MRVNAERWRHSKPAKSLFEMTVWRAQLMQAATYLRNSRSKSDGSYSVLHLFGPVNNSSDVLFELLRSRAGEHLALLGLGINRSS